MIVAEETLTRQALAGDADALNQLLCHHDAAVRGRLAPKIDAKHRSVIDVDDVLQVTYMEAFLRIGSFEYRGSGTFLAWLTQIAQNNLRDAVRGLQAEKRPSADKRIQPYSDESYARLLSSLTKSVTTPSGHATRDEWRVMLDESLQKLPEDYEKVIRLYYLQGLSAAEVGEEMKRSAPAIHMLKGRAFEQLGALLSDTRFFGKSV